MKITGARKEEKEEGYQREGEYRAKSRSDDRKGTNGATCAERVGPGSCHSPYFVPVLDMNLVSERSENICIYVYVYIYTVRKSEKTKTRTSTRRKPALPAQLSSRSSQILIIHLFLLLQYHIFPFISLYFSFSFLSSSNKRFLKLSIGVSFQNSLQKSQRAYGKTIRPVVAATFEPTQSFQALSSQPAAASQNANKRKPAESHAEKSGKKSG